VEKYCSIGLVTDDNVAHAHFMLFTYGYKHILRICKTYCFSTAAMVARTSLNVTLYVHSLSFLLLLCVRGRQEVAQWGWKERPADMGNYVDYDDCKYSVNLTC
jgi:hypothetical protein